jgi:hypothetical protein
MIPHSFHWVPFFFLSFFVFFLGGLCWSSWRPTFPLSCYLVFPMWSKWWQRCRSFNAVYQHYILLEIQQRTHPAGASEDPLSSRNQPHACLLITICLLYNKGRFWSSSTFATKVFTKKRRHTQSNSRGTAV